MSSEITDLGKDGITESRSDVERLESALLGLPQIDIEPVHYFSEGIYAREITIPAGTALTGKVHSTEHLNIVSKGRIIVITEDGKEEIIAPRTMVCRAGTKRGGYALEDTVWTTIHANPSGTRDLVQLESELIETTTPLIESEATKCLG